MEQSGTYAIIEAVLIKYTGTYELGYIIQTDNREYVRILLLSASMSRLLTFISIVQVDTASPISREHGCGLNDDMYSAEVRY